MANNTSIVVDLDGQAVIESFKKLSNSINDFGQKVESSFKKTTSQMDIFKANLLTFAAIKVGEGIASGFQAVGDAIKYGIEEAANKEEAIAKLSFALERAGIAGSRAGKDFEDFASNIEKTSMFSDDAARSSVTLLASLTNLNDKGIKQSVEAAKQLATVLGIGLEEASSMLVKAYEGNITALKRHGIAIKEGTSIQETYANTLKSLASLNGSAEASLNTYNGKMHLAHVAYKDLAAAMGEIFVKNNLILGMFNSLSDVMGNLGETIGGTSGLKESLNSIINFMLSFAQATVGVLDFIYKGFLQLSTSISSIFFYGAINPIISGLELLAKSSSSVMGYFSKDTSKAIDSVMSKVDSFRVATAKALSIDAIAGISTQDTFLSKMGKQLDEFAVKSNEFYIEENRKKDTVDKREKIEDEKNKKILESRRQLHIELASLEQKLEASKIVTKGLTGEGTGPTEIELAQQELGQKQAMAVSEYEIQVAKNNSIKDLLEKDLANKKAYIEMQIKSEENFQGYQKKQNDKNIKDQESFFATSKTLATAKNKELAAIGKAAAILDLSIKTPQAVGAAHAYGESMGGPILGAVFAGIAYAAMAAQMAQVVGIQFAQGGIVPGQSFMGDKVQARLNSGEMVLNNSQQAELFKIANGNSSSSNFDAAIERLGNRIENMNLTVQANGREIARLVREELRSGFAMS